LTETPRRAAAMAGAMAGATAKAEIEQTLIFPVLGLFLGFRRVLVPLFGFSMKPSQERVSISDFSASHE